MKSEQPLAKIKKIPRIKKPGIIIFCFVIVLAAGAAYLVTSSKASKATVTAALRTATATTEDLSTTITGSGPLISANKMDIAAKTGGTIRKIYFKQGDKIKSGQVICDLDTADALTNVQNAKNNLQQAEFTQQSSLNDLKNLTVKADTDGQITNLQVNEGDIVQKNGVLLTLIDTKTMRLTVPFNGSDISGIKVGSKATVNIQSGMESLTGRITFITNAPYSTSDGGELYNVDITLNNPGSLSEGMKASADINRGNETVSSTDTGTLTYINKTIVRSTSGGTVKKIYKKLYEYVKKGSTILTLDNPDVVNAVQTNNIKIDGLKQQLESSQKQLSYCSMVSPINGTVTAFAYKEGETLKMGDVLTSVTDTSHMVFDIPVDELDIAKVKAGQKAEISVDALTETSTLPLTGDVKDVAVEGSSSNGVSTYNVTVEVTGVTDPRTLFARMRQSGNGVSSGQGSSSSSQGNGFSFNRQNRTGNNSNGGGFSQNQGSGNNSGGYSQRANGQSGNGGFFGMGGQNSGSGRNFARFDTSTLLTSLKDGMNANATIYITENKGVLAVPLEAVTRINGQYYVMVKSDAATVEGLKKSGKYIDIFKSASNSGGSSQGRTGSNQGGNTGNSGNSGFSGYGNYSGSGNARSTRNSGVNSLLQNKDYYKEAIPTAVEVGMNTSSYIQITSGLKEGDVVLLPPVITSSKVNTSSSNGMGLGGMFGGGFGGGQNRMNRNQGGSGNSYGNGSGSSARSGGSGGGN